MKQCPLCHRSYTDDLNFCLEDGRLLIAVYDDEATRVSPAPTPPRPDPDPTPDPNPPIPEPPATSSRTGWIIFGVIAVVVLALLGGGLILLLWLFDHEQQPQHSTSGPTSASTNPTPGSSSSPTLPCEQSPFGCYTPTPTPTVAQIPSPSPSPNPTATEPVEQSLSTGTYQCERSFKEKEHTSIIRLQLTLNADGTYFQQGYITLVGTPISDQLGVEERGSYSQANDVLTMRDRSERQFNLENSSWGSWKTPRSGVEDHDKIRNVTSTTFQVYEKSEDRWYTFSKG